ncbi:MAG: DUF2656 family protein [Cyanobacteria bacterium J06641_5]
MPTRLLLSHNYSISTNEAPALGPGDFATVFATAAEDWQVRAVEHPHWRCEILTPGDDPQALGMALAQALATHRRQQLGRELTYLVLALGGLKATPATSTSPNALQQGDWGVDIVETLDVPAFLKTIEWENLIAGRPETEIFQAIAQYDIA